MSDNEFILIHGHKPPTKKQNARIKRDMPTENIGLDLVLLESCVYLFSYWLNETVAHFPISRHSSFSVLFFFARRKLCVLYLCSRDLGRMIPYSVIEFSWCVWSPVWIPWTKYSFFAENSNKCEMVTICQRKPIGCYVRHKPLEPQILGFNIRKHFQFTAHRRWSRPTCAYACSTNICCLKVLF